MYINLMQVGAH